MTKKTSQMPPMKAVKNEKPTQEQLIEERTKALRQKMMAIAESAYLSIAGNPAFADKEPQELVKRAFALSEAWMAEFYGLKKKEEE